MQEHGLTPVREKSALRVRLLATAVTPFKKCTDFTHEGNKVEGFKKLRNLDSSGTLHTLTVPSTMTIVQSHPAHGN